MHNNNDHGGFDKVLTPLSDRFNPKPYGLLSLAFVFLAPLNIANAAIENTLISTPQNVNIRVDLSESITNIAIPIIVVSTNPANGTAVAFDCDGIDVGNGSVQCVDYTPSLNFVGTDTFQVTVDNAGTPEIANVVITVENPGDQNSGILPDVAMEKIINDSVCANTAPEVTVFCQIYADATTGLTPEDLRIILKALSPSDVAAQGTMGNEMVSGQLSNIAKHLATLRRGQRLAISGLVINQNGNSISGDMLAEAFNASPRGGAASANNSNSRSGWFLNGNIGGGDQTETDYEDGFDFSNNGFSAGYDYRLDNSGIVGVALGLSNTTLDIQYGQGGLDASGTSMIGYASFYPTENSYLDIILSTNLTKFDATRRIEFGTSDEIAMSENESFATAFSAGAGYNAIKGGAYTASINAKVEYIQTTINGYSETGESPFNVSIAERDVTQLSTSIGTTMSWAISTRNMVLLPQLDIYWIHQFEEEADVIEGYFSIDPNQTIFSFNSNVKDSDYAKLELGLSAVSPSGVTSFFQLGTTRGRLEFQNWRFAFGIRFEL